MVYAYIIFALFAQARYEPDRFQDSHKKPAEIRALFPFCNFLDLLLVKGI
jgi:hypothetical protein